MTRFALKLCLAGCVVLLLSGNSVAVEAATFYTIIAGDTVDTSIGKSSEKDIAMAENFSQRVATAYGQHTEEVLRGRRFSPTNLIDEVEKIRAGPNDFVFLYISAHGHKSEKHANWPIIVFEDKSYVETAELIDHIRRNSRRFLVVIDACSGDRVIQPGDRAPAVAPEPFDRAQLDRLFKRLRGGIVVTSSEPEYVSYAGLKNGSVFSVQFFRTMDGALSDPNNSESWEQILNKIRSATDRAAREAAGKGQVPKIYLGQ